MILESRHRLDQEDQSGWDGHGGAGRKLHATDPGDLCLGTPFPIPKPALAVLILRIEDTIGGSDRTRLAETYPGSLGIPVVSAVALHRLAQSRELRLILGSALAGIQPLLARG